MATEGDAIKALLDQFGADVCDAARRNLAARRRVKGRTFNRVASGRLKESLTFKNRTRYNNPILIFTTNSEETKKYADVIERGRRPNSTPPPVSEILNWMRIKPIRLRNRGGGFAPETEKGRLRAAFAIRASIAKRGIPGIRYFQEAIESELDKYGPEFLEALRKEIEIRLQIT